ncbi:hypothetical protein C4559_01250 [Candidatus Microgenomates bacterium]|nr:MAG: hypothetical protein C4559_01250 [Candidatus Microgenomates bacterium]
MMEIIPGILEKDWAEIERKINLVLPFAKTIHIDIIDGKFAPNTTFLDPAPFKKYANDVFLELHMMVENPIQYLKPWADAGFRRFIGHIEKMPDQVEFVAQGQLLGEVGLALDGPTSLDQMKVPLDDLDNIFFYTSERVGFSGPPFLPEKLSKLREIRGKNLTIPIEVDGGINEKTIVLTKNAGANRFAATSAIYKGGNPREQYKKLVNLIK